MDAPAGFNGVGDLRDRSATALSADASCEFDIKTPSDDLDAIGARRLEVFDSKGALVFRRTEIETRSLAIPFQITVGGLVS